MQQRRAQPRRAPTRPILSRRRSMRARLRSLPLLLLAAAVSAQTAVPSKTYRSHVDRYPPPGPMTLAEWTTRAAYLREHVLASAGLLPLPDKTPLHPVVFGEVARADYTVAKVYFE